MEHVKAKCTGPISNNNPDTGSWRDDPIRSDKLEVRRLEERSQQINVVGKIPAVQEPPKPS